MSSDPIIRRPLAEDAGQIAGLLAELGYSADAELVEARIIEHRDDSRSDVQAVYVEGLIIGFGSVHAIPVMHERGYVARITSLVIDPAFRRRGIGRGLVEALEQLAGGIGCHRIEVTSGEARDDAHAFYRALGYEPVSQRFMKYLQK